MKDEARTVVRGVLAIGAELAGVGIDIADMVRENGAERRKAKAERIALREGRRLARIRVRRARRAARRRP